MTAYRYLEEMISSTKCRWRKWIWKLCRKDKNYYKGNKETIWGLKNLAKIDRHCMHTTVPQVNQLKNISLRHNSDYSPFNTIMIFFTKVQVTAQQKFLLNFTGQQFIVCTDFSSIQDVTTSNGQLNSLLKIYEVIFVLNNNLCT